MNEIQSKVAAFLKMPDEKYFDLDEDDVLGLQTRLVKAFGARKDASVLAIGAPETVSLKERSELPMLMALRYTGMRQWEVDYKQNIRILAVDLHTGSAMIERPFINAKRQPVLKPSMSGSPPDEFNSTATSAFVRKIDVRQRLLLPWQPSRLALTVFLHDWKSNPTVVELTGEETAAPEGIVAAEPSPFLSSTAPSEDSPSVQTGEAALSVPSRVPQDALATIHGAIDLPADQAVVLENSEEAAGGYLVSAVVLMQAKDDPHPPCAVVRAPAKLYKPADGAKTHVRSFFSFDVQTALPEKKLSGTYLVYLVVGSLSFGPYEMVAGN